MKCCMRLYVTCVVFLVLNVIPTSCHSITIEEKHVAAEANGTLVVNCSINSTAVNASTVYFTINWTKVPNQYLRILDANTVQLRYPNIQRSLDNEIIRCKSGNSSSYAKWLEIMQPPIPVQVDCTLFSWDLLECSWAPSYASQSYHCGKQCYYFQEIYLKLYWPNTDELNRNSCNSSSNCEDKISYSWPLDKLSTCQGEELTVVVDVFSSYHHLLSHPASHFTIYNSTNLCGLVVPSPVTGFEDTHVVSQTPNKTSFSILSWEEPYVPETSSQRQLRYNLSYHASWGDEILSGQATVDEASYEFETKPYTNYTVDVSVHLVGSRKWGQPEKFYFYTPPQIPYANPCHTPYSFFLEKTDRCPNNRRRVTILCQSVDKKYWNGPGFGSQLQMKNVGADSWLTGEKMLHEGGQVVSVSHCVSPPQILRILSGNDVGPAVADEATIFFIPEKVSIETDLFVEYDNGTVSINWHFDEHGSREQRSLIASSVFWCESGIKQHCSEGKLHHEHVEAGKVVFETELHRSDFTNYLFGVAPEVKGSSGIRWSSKYYVRGQAPVAPLMKNVKEGSHGILTFSIDIPKHTPETGRISHFVVRYAESRESFEERNFTLIPWSHEPVMGHLEVKMGTKYDVTVYSVTEDDIYSQPSKPIVFSTSKSWKTTGAIVGICVAVPVMVLLVCCGIWYLIRHMSKAKKKMLHIPIKTPSHRKPHASTSSALPLTTQISTDSGVGPDDNGYLSSPTYFINGNDPRITSIPESPHEEVFTEEAEREHLLDAATSVQQTGQQLTIDTDTDTALFNGSDYAVIDIKTPLDANKAAMVGATREERGVADGWAASPVGEQISPYTTIVAQAVTANHTDDTTFPNTANVSSHVPRLAGPKTSINENTPMSKQGAPQVVNFPPYVDDFAVSFKGNEPLPVESGASMAMRPMTSATQNSVGTGYMSDVNSIHDNKLFAPNVGSSPVSDTGYIGDNDLSRLMHGMSSPLTHGNQEMMSEIPPHVDPPVGDRSVRDYQNKPDPAMFQTHSSYIDNSQLHGNIFSGMNKPPTNDYISDNFSHEASDFLSDDKIQSLQKQDGPYISLPDRLDSSGKSSTDSPLDDSKIQPTRTTTSEQTNQYQNQSSPSLTLYNGSTNTASSEMNMLKYQPVSGNISSPDTGAVSERSKHISLMDSDQQKSQPGSGYISEADLESIRNGSKQTAPSHSDQHSLPPASGYISEADLESMCNRSSLNAPPDSDQCKSQPVSGYISEADLECMGVGLADKSSSEFDQNKDELDPGYITEADLESMRNDSTDQAIPDSDLKKTQPTSEHVTDVSSTGTHASLPVSYQPMTDVSSGYISEADLAAMNDMSASSASQRTEPEFQPMAECTSKADREPEADIVSDLSPVRHDERSELPGEDISSVIESDAECMQVVSSDLHGSEADRYGEESTGAYITYNELEAMKKRK